MDKGISRIFESCGRNEKRGVSGVILIRAGNLLIAGCDAPIQFDSAEMRGKSGVGTFEGE